MNLHRFLAAPMLAAVLGWAPAALAFTDAEIAAESAKANAFFDRLFDEALARDPEVATQWGVKVNYGQWTDQSDARTAAELAHVLEAVAELQRTIDFGALDGQTQISYRLFLRRAEKAAEAYRWRFHNYPVNPLFGEHTGLPALLINNHSVDSLADAAAYLDRLHAFPQRIDQLIEGLEVRRRRGVVPPRFVFPLVLESSRGLLTGAPLDASGAKHILLADFETKVAALNLPAAQQTALVEQATRLITEKVKPAYEALIAKLEALQAEATDDDGAWKLPHGEEFYAFQLREMTTTDLSPDEIHLLGLNEVARIHREMETIRKQVGFKGKLPAFFKFMREDPRFYYPNTAEGKAAYLAEATAIIDRMRAKLPELFTVFPKASVVVKAVEPFRERESGGAFYEQPSVDGSRPGTYYVNLFDLSGTPKYEMEALAFHEGLPGHHMQIAIAQELTGVPKFRRMDYSFTAYVEGWGLYSELLGKEAGFYQDPYSDFGRLSLELWRAARLVVDTGIHAKKWTRAQTLQWLRENTPNSERDITTETNRYIVWPGQATAYKIGMIRLQELRKTAETQLGAKFDLRRFHDLVLAQGGLPLDVLDQVVRAWIAAEKTTPAKS